MRRFKKLIPKFLLSYYHMAWAFLSALLCGFPSKKLKIIGVTGTNGKTTVIALISKILQAGGYKVAALSSAKFQIGEKEDENKTRMTMPGKGIIQKFLSEAVKQGCDYAVLEVSSEGIAQYRHLFIDFDVAVWTNLTPEHIESHGSFEKYREAKGKFFKAVKGIHILNKSDKNFPYFLNFKAKRKYIYDLKKITTPEEEIKITEAQINSKGISFWVNKTFFNIMLYGEFNVYNALAAISVGLSQNIGLEICSKGLASVKGIPGRMELIKEKPFKILIDYAFTPNALEQVYSTILNHWHANRMICVLGSCGGGRGRCCGAAGPGDVLR